MQRQGHYLRRNHRCDLPRRLVILDTETIPEAREGVEHHRLRCLASSRDRLGPDGRPVEATEWWEGTDPEAFWWWVTHAEAKAPKTYLYAHNVQFDLLAAGAFTHLPDLGWRLEHWNIGGRSDWFWWRRGKASMVCANSVSWLPMSVETLGGAVDVPKLPMPDAPASDEEWAAYCAQDVAVVRAAMLRVIQWVADEDLGSWRYTPAAQGFAAWRHRFLRMRPYVHGSPQAHRLERLAYHAGRCEAYRLGAQVEGEWWEMDFQNAYPALCATHPVPAELVEVRGDMTTPRYLGRPEGVGVIGEVTITTERPVVPVRTDVGTVWPTGRFRTWLPGPEIDLALEAGATVEWGQTAVYTMAPILADFARWILDRLEGPDAIADPIIRGVVKRWGQSFVGRLGARRRGWERLSEDEEAGAGVEYVIDAETGEMARTCRLAGAWWREVDMGEGENAITAIAAWVTSLARVRMAEVIDLAGRETVAYLDTDGVIVDAAGRRRLERAMAAGRLPGLRVKREIRRLRVWGPGAYEVDGAPRVKGLPSRARPLKGGGWSGERWQGVLESVQAGDVTRPLVERGRWRMPEPEPKGVVETAPRIEWQDRTTIGPQGRIADEGDPIVTPYRVEMVEGMAQVCR